MNRSDVKVVSNLSADELDRFRNYLYISLSGLRDEANPRDEFLGAVNLGVDNLVNSGKDIVVGHENIKRDLKVNDIVIVGKHNNLGFEKRILGIGKVKYILDGCSGRREKDTSVGVDYGLMGSATDLQNIRAIILSSSTHVEESLKLINLMRQKPWLGNLLPNNAQTGR